MAKVSQRTARRTLAAGSVAVALAACAVPVPIPAWPVGAVVRVDFRGTGSVVRAAGSPDLDGDGFADLALAFPHANVGAIDQAGVLVVVSTRTGAELLRLSGEGPTERMGRALGWGAGTRGVELYFSAAGAEAGTAAIRLLSAAGAAASEFVPRIDCSPGRCDALFIPARPAGIPGVVALGSRWEPGDPRSGAIRLFDRATGRLLSTIEDSPWERMGSPSVEPCGDINDDGVPDLVAAFAWGSARMVSFPDRILVLDGRDPARIMRRIEKPEPGAICVAPFPPNTTEVALGQPNAQAEMQMVNGVGRITTGGQVLYLDLASAETGGAFSRGLDGREFGAALAVLEAERGPAGPLLCVAWAQAGVGGQVSAYDTLGTEPVWTTDTDAGGRVGLIRLVPLPDIDGDGFADLAVAGEIRPGDIACQVLSGRTGAILLNVTHAPPE